VCVCVCVCVFESESEMSSASFCLLFVYYLTHSRTSEPRVTALSKLTGPPSGECVLGSCTCTPVCVCVSVCVFVQDLIQSRSLSLVQLRPGSEGAHYSYCNIIYCCTAILLPSPPLSRGPRWQTPPPPPEAPTSGLIKPLWVVL